MVCLICFTQENHFEFIVYLHMLVVVGEKEKMKKTKTKKEQNI